MSDSPFDPPVIKVYAELLNRYRLAMRDKKEDEFRQIDTAIDVLERVWPQEIAAYLEAMK